MTETRTVDLDVTGMTCASCAARIEKKLNSMPGVVATVNYATEKAKVSFSPDVEPADLDPERLRSSLESLPPCTVTRNRASTSLLTASVTRRLALR